MIQRISKDLDLSTDLADSEVLTDSKYRNESNDLKDLKYPYHISDFNDSNYIDESVNLIDSKDLDKPNEFNDLKYLNERSRSFKGPQ